MDDAATAELMDRFYESLMAGETVSSAVAHAQRVFRGRPDRSHPFYWAGFEVIGDGTMAMSFDTGGAWAHRVRRRLGAGTAVTGLLFVLSGRSIRARRRRTPKTS